MSDKIIKKLIRDGLLRTCRKCKKIYAVGLDNKVCPHHNRNVQKKCTCPNEKGVHIVTPKETYCFKCGGRCEGAL